MGKATLTWIGVPFPPREPPFAQSKNLHQMVCKQQGKPEGTSLGVRDLDLSPGSSTFFFLVVSLAVLGLHFYMQAFPRWGEQGYSSLWRVGFPLLWSLSLCSRGSRVRASVVVAHELSRPAACGIFPDQGSNPCGVLSMDHQGSPSTTS